MIQGHGVFGAPIMFIGDYGGKDDEATGKALSGTYENTIKSFLHPTRHDFRFTYRTLLIKSALPYLGKNKRKVKEEITKAIKDIEPLSFETILRDEILDIKPNVIVPMGGMALKFLTGYDSITAYRGSVLPLSHDIQSKLTYPVRVIPTYSPKMVWEDHVSRVYIQLDYHKIVENKDKNYPIKSSENVWVCRSMEQFNNFLARQKNIEFCTFDIETYLGYPTCISFCFDGKEAISVPFHDYQVSFADGLLMARQVAKILASNIPKVNQNIKFDWITLEKFRLRVENVAGDTMLGFHLLYPELPKNLGFQNSIYTDLPYFKDEGGKATDYNPKAQIKDRLYLYNAKDALSTWQIHKAQQEDLKERGMEKLYKEKIVPLIGIYKRIDEAGLRVDETRKARLNAKYRTLRDVSLETLSRLAGREVNPRSPTVVGKLVYEELKFPNRTKTDEFGKKTYKCDKETLEELAILFSSNIPDGKQILNLILNCRKLHKVLEYINTPLHPGGILKTSYNLAGTKSGRTSAGKTLDTIVVKNGNNYEQERLGRSLQTITKHGFELDGDLFDSPEDTLLGKDLRSMFVPRKGYVYVEGDLNQAEARAVAVLSNDLELLAQFDQKPKVHAKTAGLIYGLDPSTIGKDQPRIPGTSMTYYDMGKRVRHAGNYNMGPFRLAQMTHLEFSECKKILDRFHQTNPKIRNVFHYEVYRCLQKESQLTTPLGRVRDFFDRHSEHLKKEAISYIPQSTISDVLKFAMIRIAERAPWAIFIVEAHDGLLAEVPHERVEEYAKIFSEEVQQPVNYLKCSLSRDYDLSIPAEISVGPDSWMDMRELNV